VKILDFRIVPGLDQTYNNTEFNWLVSSIGASSITVDLMFSKPLMISQFGTDSLVAEIGQRRQFKDEDGFILPKRASKAEKAIPRQFRNAAEENLIERVGQIVARTAEATFASNLILNWVL